MQEETIFQRGNIVVTTSQIRLADKVFAVRNVGSVQVTESPVGVVPFLLMILGALAGLATIYFAAVVLAVMGFVVMVARLRTRRIILVAGGGEVVGYETHDAALATALGDAIADAISRR